MGIPGKAEVTACLEAAMLMSGYLAEKAKDKRGKKAGVPFWSQAAGSF